jgi:hypothetical protein
MEKNHFVVKLFDAWGVALEGEGGGGFKGRELLLQNRIMVRITPNTPQI